ncbi:hypothetical protein HBI56_184430 [Parastagonospora nodorum]|uniref:Spherulin-4 n=1 Tax=Phaeosphaeria nodorum (strain SN15 / ATCC MYA-4574 / FGSC 10173) TaxID=321614 RepID=A0A7U2FCY7_PHANO|nr:hypothetical protein HBH56_192890 [Parastagonospora nodorum]QRD02982.1 hypothetical protein JI435_142270 [Parastagonospora nodorum SN15]KAH3937965.1 hypothetical protein HBH54_009070 [Parastagonospora nodorum]KAH3940829.1 hypothetical protein HBH53_213230 [Parastagonospora nodorum]KAH3966530.1 hypothetical protein HBH52_198030 [Parastagonospora nodorum]
MAGSILVPLYVYPSGGAWEPVFAMATSFPQVQFTAVINVHDGPGYGALPDPEYSHAITTLNGFSNVRTVGYVATTWCERDLSSALDDVAAYSFWGEYQDSLAIDGIFVDETPTQYSQAFDSYLQTIAQAVHASDGLKEGYIVHNPGALPDPQFFGDSTSQDNHSLRPDLTVVFEDSYSSWIARHIDLTDATKRYDRTKLAVVLHSVPDLSIVETTTTLKELLSVGHSVWLTSSDNYTNLDAHFSVLLDCLVTLLMLTRREANVCCSAE